MAITTPKANPGISYAPKGAVLPGDTLHFTVTGAAIAASFNADVQTKFPASGLAAPTNITATTVGRTAVQLHRLQHYSRSDQASSLLLFRREGYGAGRLELHGHGQYLRRPNRLAQPSGQETDNPCWPNRDGTTEGNAYSHVDHRPDTNAHAIPDADAISGSELIG
jgi:hypothetical protein